MWEVLVITDRTVLANLPVIVQHYKKEKTCLLIDIDIPYDSNINTQKTEKLSSYKDLEIEVSRAWRARKNTCANYSWSIRNN